MSVNIQSFPVKIVRFSYNKILISDNIQNFADNKNSMSDRIQRFSDGENILTDRSIKFVSTYKNKNIKY